MSKETETAHHVCVLSAGVGEAVADASRPRRGDPRRSAISRHHTEVRWDTEYAFFSVVITTAGISFFFVIIVSGSNPGIAVG